jgi:hypothetical protein
MALSFLLRCRTNVQTNGETPADPSGSGGIADSPGGIADSPGGIADSPRGGIADSPGGIADSLRGEGGIG